MNQQRKHMVHPSTDTDTLLEESPAVKSCLFSPFVQM